MTAQSLLAIILICAVSVNLAAGPAIGIATAQGSFQLDRARVSGNATLFEGALVETAEASSRLQLHGGTRFELAPESRAKVYGKRLALEQGVGEMETSSAYQLEARTLRIATAEPKSIVRVRVDGDKAVLVEALKGPVRVYNRSGLLVANVKAGSTLSFQPQAAADDAFQMEGCLLRKDGKFVLADQTGNQVVEVRGADLAQQVGNRVAVSGVAVSGATPVAGASQVIELRKIDPVSTGGCLAVASQIGAESPRPPGAPKAAGEKKSHTGAIIAGVAVAGAGGGIAVAVCCKGKKSTSP